ncbi:MAG: M48 family metalloprotease [Pseudomonadota bacterium]
MSSNTIRKLCFAAGVAATLLIHVGPAYAQGFGILRDTETEEMLKNYEAPLAKAAGLDPDAVKTYLVGDPSLNAFAMQPANLFICAGMLLWMRTPNELIGVLAHETGHISGAHLTRGSFGAKKAMIPMLASIVLGLGAIIAGAGELGMVMMGMGQAVAEAQFMTFTRVQESSADQIAARLLLATRQSPKGLVDTFRRFAQADAMRAAYNRPDRFASSHPVGQDRVFDLMQKYDSSPYREIQDSPQSLHTFQMVQAKLAGFVLPVKDAMIRFPVSDTSAPARYARSFVYMRQPNFQKALAEITSLIQEEPNNPYFYEVRGQIQVSMAKPALALSDYQKAVSLRPNAPQLRLALAGAQLATEDPAQAAEALKNLKAALLVENDDIFTWYQTAQAYSAVKNVPMADLATAELWYNAGDMRRALVFATRARGKLTQGSADWERAQDIIGAAGPLASQQRG